MGGIADGALEEPLVKQFVALELLEPEGEVFFFAVTTFLRRGLLEYDDLLELLVERPHDLLDGIYDSYVNQFKALLEHDDLALALKNLFSYCLQLLLNLAFLLVTGYRYFSVSNFTYKVMDR